MTGDQMCMSKIEYKFRAQNNVLFVLFNRPIKEPMHIMDYIFLETELASLTNEIGSLKAL